MDLAPELRERIVADLRAAGARFAFLHGSRATGSARAGSDIDVGAHFGGAPPDVWRVDVPPGVDLVSLERAPLELAGRIALHGELLFDDDPPSRVEWLATTRLVYCDEEYLQRQVDRGFREARLGRERRLHHLVDRIDEDLSHLERRRTDDRRALANDVDRLAATKYFLLTAIEGCVAVSQHMCASEGWGPPSDNPDAMRWLARHGVLTHDHASAMADAVRFRNVLVHEYVHVDDERVVGYLDELGGLERFVSSIATWLDREPS